MLKNFQSLFEKKTLSFFHSTAAVHYRTAAVDSKLFRTATADGSRNTTAVQYKTAIVIQATAAVDVQKFPVLIRKKTLFCFHWTAAIHYKTAAVDSK